MRSCVGGNCDVEDVSWLCQVQVAPVPMCMVMMMVMRLVMVIIMKQVVVIKSYVSGEVVTYVDDVSWICQVQVAPVLMCLDIGGSGGDFRLFVWDVIVVMAICYIATET